MTKIAIIVEGKTEEVFIPALRQYLQIKLSGRMPRIKSISQDGRIPKGEQLSRLVRYLLDNDDYETVIALTDVYTGTNDFANAADAKRKMSQWVGDEPRFFPHVALHDFEAWLIPFWPRIKERSGTDRRPSQENPEAINHSTPPSKFLSQIYRTGSKKRDYVKAREAKAILEGQDLDVAIAACPELRELINTILIRSNLEPLA